MEASQWSKDSCEWPQSSQIEVGAVKSGIVRGKRVERNRADAEARSSRTTG